MPRAVVAAVCGQCVRHGGSNVSCVGRVAGHACCDSLLGMYFFPGGSTPGQPQESRRGHRGCRGARASSAPKNLGEEFRRLGARSCGSGSLSPGLDRAPCRRSEERSVVSELELLGCGACRGLEGRGRRGGAARGTEPRRGQGGGGAGGGDGGGRALGPGRGSARTCTGRRDDGRVTGRGGTRWRDQMVSRSLRT